MDSRQASLIFKVEFPFNQDFSVFLSLNLVLVFKKASEGYVLLIETARKVTEVVSLQKIKFRPPRNLSIAQKLNSQFYHHQNEDVKLSL